MPRKATTKAPKKRVRPMTARKVAQIAKKAVTTVAEKKFMNTERYNDVIPTQVNNTSVTNVSTIAFSTTLDDQPDGAVNLYGSGPIYEMKCLQPFFDTNAAGDSAGAQDKDLAAMKLEGKYVKPISCRTRFLISRLYSTIGPIAQGTPNTIPNSLAATLPVVCRMIRVVPKVASGTDILVNPTDDLFLTEFGQAVGVTADGFDEAEMLFYKVNNRKYKVLDDRQFQIKSPLTLQYTASTWVDGTDYTKFAPLVSNTSGNCSKQIRMSHQLTHKKHGQCYYEDPLKVLANGNSAVENSTSGQRREMILFHFAYMSPTGLVGRGTGELVSPLDVRIHNVNYTKFIDV